MLCCGLSVRLFSISKIFWRESGAAICNCQNPHWLCTGQTLRINCGKTKDQINYSAIFPVPTMFNWFSIQILRHNSQPVLWWCSSQNSLLMENWTSQHMAMFWLFHQLSIPPFTENRGKIHNIRHVHKKLIDTSIENRIYEYTEKLYGSKNAYLEQNHLFCKIPHLWWLLELSDDLNKQYRWF